MLRDVLVALIEAAPDVEIVGERSDTEGLDELVADARADVLLLGVREDPGPGRVCRLLAARDGLRLVMVARDGRRVETCELACHAIEPSPPAVLAEIRRVPARPDAD
jgi:chemotaxis response regulator CheB